MTYPTAPELKGFTLSVFSKFALVRYEIDKLPIFCLGNLTSEANSLIFSSMAYAMSVSSAAAPISTPQSIAVKTKKKAKPKYGPLPLEKYIPLGTVRYESTESADPTDSAPLEIDNKPSTYLPAQYGLARHLDTLWINGWIRIFVMQLVGSMMAAMRIYLIPDDTGRGLIPREDKKVRSSLKAVLAAIDCSRESWNALSGRPSTESGYEAVCDEQDSLFYIFNTLRPPSPEPETVNDKHASLAMHDILEDAKEYLGLKTTLYDYQKRCAAMMIQREAHPALQLDSRLEVLHAPTGQQFYFDRVAVQILSEKRSYEETRGGILAETMGHGKTLISLAVVLATRGHLPRVPLEYQAELKPRPINENQTGAASLKTMAGRAIYQHAVPWKSYFNDLAVRGEYPESCQRFIEQNPSWYSIPEPPRARRPNYRPAKEKRIYLSSTTLIVVPPNLMAHWQQEIATHLQQGILLVLPFQDDSQSLPSAMDLLKADVILMSKTRFEDEMSPRKNNLVGRLGKAGTRQYTSLHTCCCAQRRRACPIHKYHSALLDLHFLRFIVDEGHNFASSAGTRATIGLRSIHVERKWIISGTPSKGLLGLEIDMATDDINEGDRKTSAEHQREILEKRRVRPSAESEGKYLAALGHAVTNFLGLQPWANSRSQEDSASWSSYLAPDANGVRKAGNLRCVLESLVVRHRMGQIEKDLQLPPLKNRVVFLEPCYLDKVSLNLFTLVLVSNAITSERTDQDYMFHSKNRPQLERLIKNLRHSPFHWTGFCRQDVAAPVRFSKAYLDDPERHLTPEDARLLQRAVEMGERALQTMGWTAFADTKELGLYVKGIPRKYEESWALCGSGSNRNPLLIGATYLNEVQAKIDSNIYASDPFRYLERSWGQSPWQSNAIPIGQATSPALSSSSKGIAASSSISKKLVPLSSVESTQKLTTKEFNMHKKHDRAYEMELSPSDSDDAAIRGGPGRKSILKSTGRSRNLPDAYSEAAKVKLIGTASAKLSYLLDKILELYMEEKILIFYDADYIAFYIAQVLEILKIPHEIYASGLKLETRSKYLEKFNNGQHTRVLLMDLKQAAHGLHVASASRVFFVNPLWNPSIEAQAIKRAHRIGQSMPVHVETLVLKGTIEEKMLQRRKAMTTSEHEKASKSPLDDMAMNDIIKNMGFHWLTVSQMDDEAGQHAPLKIPQQVCGREFMGHERAAATGTEESAAAIDAENSSTPTTNPRKRKTIIRDGEDQSPLPKIPRLEMTPQKSNHQPASRTSSPATVTTPLNRKLVFEDEVNDVRLQRPLV